MKGFNFTAPHAPRPVVNEVRQEVKTSSMILSRSHELMQASATHPWPDCTTMNTMYSNLDVWTAQRVVSYTHDVFSSWLRLAACLSLDQLQRIYIRMKIDIQIDDLKNQKTKACQKATLRAIWWVKYTFSCCLYYYSLCSAGKSRADHPAVKPELSTPVLSAVPLKTNPRCPLSPQSSVSWCAAVKTILLLSVGEV